MKYAACLAFTTVFIAAALGAQESEEGFVRLNDGQTFAGWQVTKENPGTWQIVDGAFVTRGPRAHLFYTGDGVPFKNFELKVEVMTEPGANGGIYFHTAYQDTGWPTTGFETQVNNTHSDWKKTGSVYDVASVGFAAAEDRKWWTQHIIVAGNVVTVKVDGKIVVQYKEPPGAQPGAQFTRKLAAGTFALQAHDPKSVVHYRNIRVKRLPD
ncbi:MAG: DUF1080 domain-containing protein [Lacunisphaera sp.]|nr:DUF1080 domain-containing protein [Lacunisphaera sp.]